MRPTRRPARILVVIPTLDVGGAETDLIRILPRLDRDRFEIVVHTFLHPGTMACHLTAAGIPLMVPGGKQAVEAPSATPVARPRSLMRRVLSTSRTVLGHATGIARHVRAGKFDLVHAILPNAYLVSALGRTLAGGRRPLVMSRLSLNWYQQEMPPWRMLERRMLHPSVDIAIGNSLAVLQNLRDEGIPDRKLRLVHNGIDAEHFAGRLIGRQEARRRLDVSADALVMTAVANLHHYKGHDDLIDALALIRDRLPPDWVLLLVGRDTNERMGVIGRAAERLGIRQHLRFLGERPDVPEILSAADLHVSASHTEGFPNNILEAMSAGLPIVATAVGGVPEQILDGETGLLVPARDPPRLAAAIALLAEDPERRSQLGHRAREHVARIFPLSRTVAAFEEIYGSLTRTVPARDSDAADR
jgi:glycosyltransferase involved in cell wall biosynthesis